MALGVRVKLKTTQFQILTRQRRRQQPTDVAKEIYADAAAILDEFTHPGPFRLVGLAAYDLEQEGQTAQMDMFASRKKQDRRLEVALDDLAQRFGPDILRRADDLKKRRETANLDFLQDNEETDEG